MTSAATPPVLDLLEQVVSALNGSDRPGQQAMAREVAAAVEKGEHLLVQAGTGTGKSVAYLVPALRACLADEQRVIVSTATLALQRQLIAKDVPAVLDVIASAGPRRPEVALLKGRANYLCLHKVAGGYPAPDDADTLFELELGEREGGARSGAAVSRLGREVTRLRAWAETTDTGDRDDLEVGVTPRAWAQVSTSALECLGTKCPVLQDCFAERARALAADADLVITNHAMLAVEATSHPVLPEHGVLIVDEAHELVDRITSAFSRAVSGRLVATAARRVHRALGRETGALDRAGDQLAALLAGLRPGRLIGGPTPEVHESLSAVLAQLRLLEKDVKEAYDKSGDGGAKQALSGLTELRLVVERLVDAGDGDVVWATAPTAFDDAPPALHIAPLDVAGMVRDKLIGDKAAVLTSATLALGGSLTGAATAVGLGAEGVDWRGLDVGSAFDYPRQAILYVASDLPAPGRDGTPPAQLDVLEQLLSAAGGRALCLFSSRRAALSAAEELRGRVGTDILCQGDELLSALVARFVAEESASLFGTLSLWQGVDAPGATCRLVTIDRIPFPRPDDPVSSARQDAVAARGGNGFMAVAAAHAALLLAQGSGRLIRRASDRGVVAVLDPRLVTARYGSYLRRTMPPMWMTTDVGVACQALARLDEGNNHDREE